MNYTHFKYLNNMFYKFLEITIPAGEVTNSTNKSSLVPTIECGNFPIPQKVPISGLDAFLPSYIFM